ncbi:tripartite tricarboxylate transporter TctB family protein [Agrobacterium burrii]|uniref:Tripartite tricarboxylate transporter TctB family protein n=1 Tax=Agrobacterium burrii TaxID=2815339 RepID=A0ABS3EJW1_9HYPH|nr:tripartite tricarboxylate transporter TctB family protein [Agrobacterium burrii]MBO0132247.1 tripartite tricarboxylate transporter TctB family protein [Agrobacterium burrii]
MKKKEALSSLVVLLIGGTFAASSAFTLDLGTTLKMGPGFFPLVLSCILLAIGGVLLFTSLEGDEKLGIHTVSARSIIAIITAPILFGLVVRGAGFVPAVAATTLSASMASAGLSFLKSAAITVGMTAFCVAVFVYGLGLPVRLIGPWLGV